MKQLAFRVLQSAVMLLLLQGIAASQTGKVIDKIVAVVGNEIITLSELEIQLLRASVQQELDTKDETVRRSFLEEMMKAKLILAEAILDSIEVSEEQVTAQLDDQIKHYERMYGSRQQLERISGMTVSEMKRAFREDIRKNLMVTSLKQQKFGTMTVNHREVEEFYSVYQDSLPQVPEQVELWQISIFPRVTDTFREAARKKAQAILDSLQNGADFSELAKRHSDDINSGKKGGSLGLARRGVFVKEFEEAAFSLSSGEISPLVETQFGFHIIKLIEKKGEAINAQHILIRVEKTGESDAAAKDTLNILRDRIIAGESFEELARNYSEDPVTKKHGGELGLVEVPELSADLKRIQQELLPGQISNPEKISFEKDHAYVIVKLVRRIQPHNPSLTDDYQRISNYARIFKQNSQYSEWIESIKKSVYWKIHL